MYMCRHFGVYACVYIYMCIRTHTHTRIICMPNWHEAGNYLQSRNMNVVMQAVRFSSATTSVSGLNPSKSHFSTGSVWCEHTGTDKVRVCVPAGIHLCCC